MVKSKPRFSIFVMYPIFNAFDAIVGYRREFAYAVYTLAYAEYKAESFNGNYGDADSPYYFVEDNDPIRINLDPLVDYFLNSLEHCDTMTDAIAEISDLVGDKYLGNKVMQAWDKITTRERMRLQYTIEAGDVSLRQWLRQAITT